MEKRPTNTQRIIFTLGFFLSVYIMSLDLFLGILFYFVVHWCWLTFLSFTSQRFLHRTKINPNLNSKIRVLAVLGVFAIVAVVGSFGFAPLRYLFYLMSIYRVALFLIPTLFLITTLVMGLDLYDRMEIEEVKNTKPNKIIAILLLPLGLWTIALKKVERKVYH